MARARRIPKRAVDIPDQMDHPGFSVSEYREYRPDYMPRMHFHAEVESNLLVSGGVSYLYGGTLWEIKSPCTLLFWGSKPHILLDHQPHTCLYSLHIPLQMFLEWGFPAKIRDRLLGGEAVMAPSLPEDPLLWQRWHAESSCDSADMLQVMALEVEARVRRIGIESLRNAETPARVRSDHGSAQAVERMLLFIAEHYHEDIAVADVCGTVGLNPNYGNDLFHRTYGCSVLACINAQRLAHAQAMLLTSDASVLEIAMDSGFGSVSWFHRLFRRMHGVTPSAYRRRGGA